MFPHLPLSHAAVVLASLLDQLLTHGFPLLLQAALPLQLLKFQILKLFGSCFQRLSVLMEAPGEYCQKLHHIQRIDCSLYSFSSQPP